MADETVQTQLDPMKAEPGAPTEVNPAEILSPNAPDIADEQPTTAAEVIEQDTSAPAVDIDSLLFSRFRRLWNGGERRAALEWAKAEQVAEDEWAALLAEFPELLDIINGN